MAQSAIKRPRPSKGPSAKHNKRQKLDKPPRPEPITSTKHAQKHKVKLDSLQWRDVEMPDRLEDFEGFYGLEEIDDVDVVRDSATGMVFFESSKPVDGVETADTKKDGSEVEKATTEDDKESDAGSWEGFGDEAEAADDIENEKVQGEPSIEEEQAAGKKSILKKKDSASELREVSEEVPSNKTKKEKKEKRKKTQKSQDKPDDTLRTGDGAFAILAEQPTDGDDAEDVDVSAWDELGLSADTLSSLQRLKFSTPTPIQSSAIPEILAGHDVIGKASTGSGKTLAFGIPILESFLATPKSTSETKIPLAMIISPTRELAHQITEHLTKLCSGGDFDAPYIASITGGLSVQKQRRQLEKADIVVGTPGRLWEVISDGHGLLKSFKQIRFLVVDEADRLLSEGHYKEMGEILKVLDRDDRAADEEDIDTSTIEKAERQTLVFSATFQKGLQQKLAGKISKGGDLMNNQQSMEYLLKKLNFREEKPKFIDANPSSQMASRLKEGLIECAGTEKDLFLYALLLFHPKKRALIFTNSISAVRRLTPYLQNLDLPALPLHSQMPQKARLRSIERFKERPGSILVATDVAARGLDIPGVQLIVHYHLPRAADGYVHRSGRTARAEASGTSILICAPEEVAGVRRLVAKVHARSSQAPQTAKAKKTAYYIRTLDIDRRIVSRLKPRATLAKKLADTVIAKEKKHSEDDWLRTAAEDLGVDYDSETFEAEAKGKKGRGSGRKKKEREASEMSKGEVQVLRAELKGLLGMRINVGVSERYLTRGGIDLEALMRGEGGGEFLGEVEGLGFDEEG